MKGSASRYSKAAATPINAVTRTKPRVSDSVNRPISKPSSLVTPLTASSEVKNRSRMASRPPRPPTTAPVTAPMTIVADSNLILGSSMRYQPGRTSIAAAASVDRASLPPMSSILLDSRPSVARAAPARRAQRSHCRSQLPGPSESGAGSHRRRRAGEDARSRPQPATDASEPCHAAVCQAVGMLCSPRAMRMSSGTLSVAPTARRAARCGSPSFPVRASSSGAGVW